MVVSAVLILCLFISLSLTCSFSSALFDYLIWLLQHNSLCCFKRIFTRLTRWWFLGTGKYAPFLIQLSKCKNWSFFRCRYCLILLDIFLSFENYSRCMSFILTLLYYWASSTQLIRGDLFDFCFLYVPCYAHNNYDTSNYIYFPLLSVS